MQLTLPFLYEISCTIPTLTTTIVNRISSIEKRGLTDIPLITNMKKFIHKHRSLT